MTAVPAFRRLRQERCQGRLGCRVNRYLEYVSKFICFYSVSPFYVLYILQYKFSFIPVYCEFLLTL